MQCSRSGQHCPTILSHQQHGLEGTDGGHGIHQLPPSMSPVIDQSGLDEEINQPKQDTTKSQTRDLSIHNQLEQREEKNLAAHLYQTIPHREKEGRRLHLRLAHHNSLAVDCTRDMPTHVQV